MNIEIGKGIKGIATVAAGLTVSFLCLWGCSSMHPSVRGIYRVSKRTRKEMSGPRKTLSMLMPKYPTYVNMTESVSGNSKEMEGSIENLENLLKRLDKPSLLGNIVSCFQDKVQWLGSKCSSPVVRIASCVGSIAVPSYLLYTDYFKQVMSTLGNELWKNAYLIAQNPEEHVNANISGDTPITDTCGYHFQRILGKSVTSNDSLKDIIWNYPSIGILIGCVVVNNAYLLAPIIYAPIKWVRQTVFPRRSSNKEKLEELTVLCKDLKRQWRVVREERKSPTLAESNSELLNYPESLVRSGLNVIVQYVKVYIEENSLTEFKAEIEEIEHSLSTL